LSSQSQPSRYQYQWDSVKPSFQLCRFAFCLTFHLGFGKWRISGVRGSKLNPQFSIKYSAMAHFVALSHSFRFLAKTVFLKRFWKSGACAFQKHWLNLTSLQTLQLSQYRYHAGPFRTDPIKEFFYQSNHFSHKINKFHLKNVFFYWISLPSLKGYFTVVKLQRGICMFKITKNN
jgi:hypothetical protein